MHKLNNNSGYYKLYPIITPDGLLFKTLTYFVGPLLFLMDPFFITCQSIIKTHFTYQICDYRTPLLITTPSWLERHLFAKNHPLFV